MANNAKERWAAIERGREALAKVDEESLNAFVNFNSTALKAGALDTKTKLLMTVAIAVAVNGEFCIVGRTREALEAGASRQELIESAAVGRMMGGSLAMANSMTLFLDALDTFAPDFGK
jgi:AhpD family alkylhydroperoxidase